MRGWFLRTHTHRERERERDRSFSDVLLNRFLSHGSNHLSRHSILVRVGKNTYENLGTSNLPQKLLQMKYQEIKFRGGDYGKWVREGVIREEEIQEVKEAGVREELKR